MREPVLTVERLRKSYGGTEALAGVSLTARRGEVLGVLGPNGAGKTTLLEALVGLRRPDSGTVRVLGLDPRRDRTRLLARIGVQPQTGALFRNLTVHETARLWQRFYPSGLGADELLSLVELTARAGDRVKALSTGQAQRLRLALAFAGQPELVLLDEPTGALDPHARELIWAAMARLRAGTGTVLLTTHSMEEAQRVCDRVVILDCGRLVADGAPAALLDAHGGRSLHDVFLAVTGRAPTEEY